MHIDHVVIAEPLCAPDALEQSLAAEDDARLGRECVEQVELDLRQLDRFTRAADLASARVDL